MPCATMDACLYAVGYAAWHRYQKPSLPVQFGVIEFGRLPDPGEPCVVSIQQKQLLESGACVMLLELAEAVPAPVLSVAVTVKV